MTASNGPGDVVTQVSGELDSWWRIWKKERLGQSAGSVGSDYGEELLRMR